MFQPRGLVNFEIRSNSFAQNLDFVGDILWSVVYLLLIFGAFRDRRIGIPAIAICLNFTWEIAFTLVQRPEGIRLYTQLFWLVLDAIIVYQLFVFGERRPLSKRHFNLVFSVGLLMSFTGQMVYLQQSLESDPSGSLLAYGINVVMAFAFVMMFFERVDSEWNWIACSVAWGKMLATGIITVSVFLQFANDITPVRLMLYLGLCTAILDCYYIFLIHAARRRFANRELAPDSD